MLIVHNALKRILLGPVNYPQTIPLALHAPQSQVDVWLHGLDTPVDVTRTHMLACCAPLTICIGFDPEQVEGLDFGRKFTLRFRSHGRLRLLGDLSLRFLSGFRVGAQYLCLFRVTQYKNRLLSPLRLWAHHLQYARSYRPERNQDVPITRREARAMIVYYLCPRPVALVTVVDGDSRNLFPMNLMGSVGNGYFAFALNSHRCAAPLVERAGRIVLSSVPPEQGATVSKMGANHWRTSTAWDELPFALKNVDSLYAPVPSFAVDAQELQIEASYPLGSHTLFVARIAAQQHLSEAPQFFMAHGLYRAW